jgi:GT2 family glycosyltransferase
MKLLVAISSYRVTDLTIDCLRSLSAEIHRVPGTKVAICENGSGGDAAERLRAAIKQNGWDSGAQVTEVYPNRGFTGGTNAVIRPALESNDPPQYVLLLNADTLVQENSLSSLVDFMDSHPQAGIAGSLLVSIDGEPQASPFRFMGIATELVRGMRLGIVSKLLSPWVGLPPKPTQSTKVEWVCTASGILRTTMLEQIGLLDEGLFTYFDDVDICVRAARAGWETWFVPESRVVHLEGASTGITGPRSKPGRRPAYWYEARQRFFTKNYGVVYTAFADAAFILGYLTWIVRRRLQGKPDPDPSHTLVDSIRHSVFCRGPKVPVVQNPALVPSSGRT